MLDSTTPTKPDMPSSEHWNEIPNVLKHEMSSESSTRRAKNHKDGNHEDNLAPYF